MEHPELDERLREPLDDEERALIDTDTWDWDTPVDAVIADNLLAVLPIKITFEESRLLARAARAEGLTPHEFIKRSALQAARVAVNWAVTS